MLFSGEVRTALLALCFPYACAGCGHLQHYPSVLCDGCAAKLPRICDPYCAICGTSFPQQWLVDVCAECRVRRPVLTRIRSAFSYEGVVMKLIRELKFSRRARCIRFFAGELYAKLTRDFPRTVSAIVPVPLHRSREWARTYNQTAILANEISALSGIPVLNILRRSRHTESQTALSRDQRRRNLDGAFKARCSNELPVSVILLDDVITTGATLEACAKELRKAGVKRIYGLTIARTLLMRKREVP